jgi:hypothetical protein
MAAEELGLFTGPGLVIVLCAALALGRASATVTQTAAAQETDTEAERVEEADEDEADEEEAGMLAGNVMAEDFRPTGVVSVRPGPRHYGGGQSPGSSLSPWP